MKIRDMIMKDLKIIFSDKSAIMMLIIMPIILMTILGYSLTMSFKDTSSMEKINIAVVKEYEMEQEKEDLIDLIPKDSDIDIKQINFEDYNIEKIFFEEFLENEEIKDILKYEILTKEDAIKKLTNKELTAIVVLPKGFIRDTMVNFGTTFRNLVNIEVIGRTDKNIGSTIVEEIIKGFTDIMTYNIASKNAFSRIYVWENIEGNVNDHIELLMDRISKTMTNDRSELEYEPLNNRPPMNSKAYYAFAMSAMFILYGASYGAKFLLEEKEMGTYGRMSASGVKKLTIVIGKASVVFISTMMQLIITYIYSSLVLGVDWGSKLNLLFIFISAAFSIASLGIMLAVIVYLMRNYNTVNAFISFLIQIMAALGGSIIPVETMPSMLRIASNFTLNGLTIKALMKNYHGYGIEGFVLYIFLLISMGIVFTIIAACLLKNEGRRVNYVKHTNAEANEV